jgi:hypothetical protein
MTPSPARVVARAAVAVALLAAASCGPAGESLHPVAGQIRVDGKPAVGALVMFHPEGPVDRKTIIPSGRVEADGRFTLMTQDRSGARAGKYIVTVIWPDPNKKITETQKMMGVSPDDAPDVLKGKYETREKSTLRAEVKPGDNTLDPFDLK